MADTVELNGAWAIELPTKYKDFKNLRVLRDSDDSFTMVPNWLMEWEEISMQEFAALSAILRKKDHFEKDAFVKGYDKYARFDNGQHSKLAAVKGLIEKKILVQTQYSIGGNWYWTYDVDVRASSFMYQGVEQIEVDDTDYEAIANEEGVTVEQAKRLYNRGKESEAAKHGRSRKKNDIQPLNGAVAPTHPSPATEPMQPETVVPPRIVEPKVEKVPELGREVSPLVLGAIIKTMGKETVARPVTNGNGKPSWVDYSKPEAPKPQLQASHVAWAQQLDAQVTKQMTDAGFEPQYVTKKIPMFVEANMDVVFADYAAFKAAFDVFSLGNAGASNGKAAGAAPSERLTVNPNDKTKGTRFVNFEKSYNEFARTLAKDKTAADELAAIKIFLSPAEWNTYIGMYHIRMAKNNCEQHASYEAYRGHFCQWLPSGMAYRLKGENIAKAKGKQAAEQKAELRTGKGGRNPYFNRMRKKINNPKPEITFTSWQMWCVELLSMTDRKSMTESDKAWFGQLEAMSKSGHLKAVYDGVRAGLTMQEIVEQL